MYRNRHNPVSDDYAKKFLARLHKAAEEEGAGLVYAGTTKSGGGKFEVYEGLEFDDDNGDFSGEFLGAIVIKDDMVTFTSPASNKGTAVLAGRQAGAEAKATMNVFHAMGSGGYSFEDAMSEFSKGKLSKVTANPFGRRNPSDPYAGVESTRAYQSSLSHYIDYPYVVLVPASGYYSGMEGDFYAQATPPAQNVDYHGLQFRPHLSDKGYPHGLQYGFRRKADADAYARQLGGGVSVRTIDKVKGKKDKRIVSIAYAFWQNSSRPHLIQSAILDRVPDATAQEIEVARQLAAYSGSSTPSASSLVQGRAEGKIRG